MVFTITHIFLISLTLKRLLNPFNSPPVVFPKIYFLGRGRNPFFLKSFLKILLKFLKLLRIYGDFLLPFIDFPSIHRIFLTFPRCKKTNDFTYNRWYQHFYLFFKYEGGVWEGGEGIKLKKLPSKSPALLELSFDVSLLIEIQYLQIGPIEKEAYTNERRTLWNFNLWAFFRWIKCIGLIENYLLVYKLFEFVVERIPAIKNKAANIFRPKNHLHYCNDW